MRRLNRFTALCVGVLLLAAPSAFACGELGAMMPSQCSMAEKIEMAETAETCTSMCHDGGQMSADCCDVRSAPEPIPALSVESVKLLTALEVTAVQIVALPASAVLLRQFAPAHAFRLHELGRYTLFSSFLI